MVKEEQVKEEQLKDKQLKHEDPPVCVIASHIFKHEWGKYKAHQAFDRSKLCFVYDSYFDEFTMRMVMVAMPKAHARRFMDTTCPTSSRRRRVHKPNVRAGGIRGLAKIRFGSG